MLSIRKKDYDFLTGEIRTWQTEGIISSEQTERILELYSVKERNLPRILLTAGIILLFLGFVSFIAAHWHELNKIFRVCIISFAYIISVMLYIFTGRSATKTGKAFLLLSSIIFGSGIFLITRMYDIKLIFSQVLGYWLIELIIVCLITHDNWELYFSQAISLIWLCDIEAINAFALYFVRPARVSVINFFSPLNACVLIIFLWLIYYFTRERPAFIINMFITFLYFASRLSLCFGGTTALIILVITGAIMSFMSKYPDIEILGILISGMFSLLLTWPEFWRGEIFIAHREVLAIVNALILACLMLINIYRGHVTSGIIFCVILASRYFFDHIFGYIPKAWGFTLTGIILLLTGIYFYLRKRPPCNSHL